MTDERALCRCLQATVLTRKPQSLFHSPMHHTLMPHQTSSLLTQPLAPIIPTPQILIHSPRHHSKRTKALTVVHYIHDPDDPFFLSPSASTHPCHSPTCPNPSIPYQPHS